MTQGMRMKDLARVDVFPLFQIRLRPIGIELLFFSRTFPRLICLLGVLPVCLLARIVVGGFFAHATTIRRALALFHPAAGPSSSFGRRACSNRPKRRTPTKYADSTACLHMKLARHPGWNDFSENVFDFSAHRVLSHQSKEVFGISLPMRNLNGKNVNRSVLEGVTPGFHNTVQIFPGDIHALSNGRSPIRSGEPIVKW
jgi:hypothetical protein